MISRSKGRAVTYPNESISVVFVGITRNQRFVDEARQNIRDRINHHNTNPTDFNPSALANLLPSLEDVCQSCCVTFASIFNTVGASRKPTVLNIDANLTQQDWQTSFETHGTDYFSDD